MVKNIDLDHNAQQGHGKVLSREIDNRKFRHGLKCILLLVNVGKAAEILRVGCYNPVGYITRVKSKRAELFSFHLHHRIRCLCNPFGNVCLADSSICRPSNSRG